ncbi:hypothetical protein DFQ28_006016 [Apophysomyces sp. BC1034]|nr:hypothetical protein DFQ28_006016 [Apophysomyces sp. BC1034]
MDPVPYDVGLKLQSFLVERRHALRNQKQVSQDPHDLICFLQHKPTYTAGRRIRGKTELEEEQRLRALGAEYFETMRGGQVTFHGPGQLIAYPILDIRDYKLNVRCYVSLLEKAVIDTCSHYGINANTTENTGVWVGNDHKIAALGVHLQRYVSSHGLALNCDIDISWFDHIVPCGLAEKKVTSISEQLHRKTTVQDVLPVLISSFQKMLVTPLVEIKQNSELAKEIQHIVLRS